MPLGFGTNSGDFLCSVGASAGRFFSKGGGRSSCCTDPRGGGCCGVEPPDCAEMNEETESLPNDRRDGGGVWSRKVTVRSDSRGGTGGATRGDGGGVIRGSNTDILIGRDSAIEDLALP